MIHIYMTKEAEDPSQVAHEMLRKVLATEYGIGEPEILYQPQGKPYIPGGPCFSISHSRGCAAVAISDQPLGLDVEAVRPVHERLPERIFSRGELEWFRRRGSLRADFFTLWTLKESYYKYVGSGLPGFPNGTDFYFDGSWHLRGENLWFHTTEEGTLLLTLCGEKQSQVRIHWM